MEVGSRSEGRRAFKRVLEHDVSELLENPHADPPDD